MAAAAFFSATCFRFSAALAFFTEAVAAWLGFHWRQPGVDGARCLLWWRQWRQERHRPDRRRVSALRLDRIFDYNRDDCLATWAVAQWLLAQDRLTPGR